ncbi:MAG: twin-arginine translocase subunit TatC [Chloroflexota bacterium]|nr:twin-arginine translocase subunit TatC [Chloroflexota bacterium]
MDKDEKLTVLGHLEDLRNRVMWAALAVAIGTVASFVFAEEIIDILKSVASDVELQAIVPTEMISTYFKLSLMCGIGLATPVITYEIVMFIRPALTSSERRYLYLLLPSVLIAFVIGVVFAYLVMVPPAINFLFNFGSGVATIEWRIGNYINVVTRLIIAIGLCFETPIIIYFLTKIGIVTAQKLSHFRRFAIVGAFIIAAIITPTFDPVNQIIVAVPLIVLYEAGIILSRIAGRNKKVPVWETDES